MGQEVIANNVTDSISNITYEERIQDEKSNIYLLDKRYISLVLNDLERIMPYKKGSTQFVDFDVVKGENIRLYE